MLYRQTETQQPSMKMVQLIDALSHDTKDVQNDAYAWLGNYSKLVLCLLFLYVKTFEIHSLNNFQ